MSSPAAATFWAWVVHHQAALRSVIEQPRGSDAPVLDELLAALHAYSDDLYFMIGGDPAGTVELIITPEGNLGAFPTVRALVDAAPPLPGWEVIAFKPAMGFTSVIQHARACIDGRSAWFQPVAMSSGQVGVRLACPDYDPAADDDYAYAAEMLLEAGLGELAARDVHGIDVVKTPPAPVAAGFRPLAELREFLSARLAGSRC